MPEFNGDSSQLALMWTDTLSAQQALEEGSITSEQLVKYYLQRIADHNLQGFELHAIATVNDQALAQARRCDE